MSLVDDVEKIERENADLRSENIAYQNENNKLHDIVRNISDVREALSHLLTIVNNIEDDVTSLKREQIVADEVEKVLPEVIPPFDEEEGEEPQYKVTHYADDSKPSEARYKVDVNDVLGGRGIL